MNRYLEKMAAGYLKNPKKYADTFSRRVMKNSSGWKRFKIKNGDELNIPGLNEGLQGRIDRGLGRLKMRETRKSSPIMSGLFDIAKVILTGEPGRRKSY